LLALDQRTLVDPQNVNHAKQSSVQSRTTSAQNLAVVVRDRRGESPLSSRAESRTLRSMVKGSRIIGATEPVNARSEKSTRERTIYPRRLLSAGISPHGRYQPHGQWGHLEVDDIGRNRVYGWLLVGHHVSGVSRPDRVGHSDPQRPSTGYI
jgi:hypothetical protein